MDKRSMMERRELDDKLARRWERFENARKKSGGARALACAACAILILAAIAAAPAGSDSAAPSAQARASSK